MSNEHQDSVKQFITNYVVEIRNKREFYKADQYRGADFKNVFAPQFEHGPEGMKKKVDHFLQAFQPFTLKLWI